MDSGAELATDIARARRGDRDAFQVLVERHSRAVFRLAWRMTGNQIDAEDMVQETFLRAWKQMSRFDGRASLGTWLHRICANCSLDHIRARKRKQETTAAPAESGEETMDPLASVPHRGPSPERLAQSSEITAMLLPALAELSEMERTAFVMRHYEGLPIEEIARALGVEAGAAKHSVFRAVQKLRRALEPAVSGSR
jgi:RNA polymerase sigma-70 factor, ECF subfamily